MGGPDGSRSDVERRTKKFADAQLFGQPAGPENIDEGVVRPGFMEMDPVERFAVDFRFGVEEGFEDVQAAPFDRGRKRRFFNQGGDVFETAAVGPRAQDRDFDPPGPQVGPFDLADLYPDRKIQGLDDGLVGGRRDAQVEESGRDHVAAQAGGSVEIDEFHGGDTAGPSPEGRTGR